MHSKKLLLEILLPVAIAMAGAHPAAAQGCTTVIDCAQKAVEAAQAAQHAAENAIPLHTIIAWFQTSGSVPAGWAICDGTNGTPDLRGRFLQGVGNVGEVSAVPVGSATHQHSFNVSGRTGNAFDNSGAHYHVQPGGPPQSPGLDSTYSFSASGTTSSASNIPPSVRVVYLMKVK